MIFNLLEPLDKMTLTTLIISIVAVVLIVGVMIMLCFVTKKMTTRSIVFAGVTIALSFCLSYIKIAPVPNGGSITLASMLPVMIYAYFYGFGPGLLCGVCHGLLQFIQSPYVLTPVTFILDYVLAFASIALVAVFKKMQNKTASLSLGITLAYFVRFLFHFISGIIYFSEGAIWTDLPQDSGIIYSLIYNAVYLVPDYFIAVVSAILLSETGVIKVLERTLFKEAPEEAQ